MATVKLLACVHAGKIECTRALCRAWTFLVIKRTAKREKKEARYSFRHISSSYDMLQMLHVPILKCMQPVQHAQASSPLSFQFHCNKIITVSCRKHLQVCYLCFRSVFDKKFSNSSSLFRGLRCWGLLERTGGVRGFNRSSLSTRRLKLFKNSDTFDKLIR